MFKEENYIMWLARIEGMSLKKKQDILNYFNKAQNFFELDSNSIKQYCIENKISSESILKVKDKNLLESYLEEIYNKKINYVTFQGDLYPELLKNIPDMPLGLYYIGEFPHENLKKIAIVGARKCTQYGSINAYQFGKDLAQNNIVVVSGMAEGIDTMAHKGAIDGKGKTIAVLGCGIDIVYPPQNINIRSQIIQNGCIISEFPPQTPPLAVNFPIRNRIVSGISDGVVVVEAAKRSGTLITVGQALDQGREIYAVPGNINSPMSMGTNDLIKECAFPLTNVEDILFNFGLLKKTDYTYRNTSYNYIKNNNYNNSQNNNYNNSQNNKNQNNSYNNSQNNNNQNNSYNNSQNNNYNNSQNNHNPNKNYNNSQNNYNQNNSYNNSQNNNNQNNSYNNSQNNNYNNSQNNNNQNKNYNNSQNNNNPNNSYNNNQNNNNQNNSYNNSQNNNNQNNSYNNSQNNNYNSSQNPNSNYNNRQNNNYNSGQNPNNNYNNSHDYNYNNNNTNFKNNIINKGINETKKEELQKNKQKNIEIMLAPNEKIVYACMSSIPITIDELIIKTKISIKELQCILTMLEIGSHIQKLAGQKYILKI